MNMIRILLYTKSHFALVFASAIVGFSSMVSTFALASEAPKFSEFDTGVETIVWDRNPIRIHLPVGSERRIDFPVEVKVNIPNDLVNVLRVTPTKEGTVFLKADADFGTNRLIAFDTQGENQYLLDVSASRDAPTNPISIYDSRIVSSRQVAKAVAEQETVTPELQRDAVFYDEVDMVRVASHQFYAPSRLATLPPGFGAAKAPAENVHIYTGENLSTKVISSWRAPTYGGGHLYVTAVEVRNRSSHEVRPDPRRITARLISMTPQHSWLAPAGNYPQDMTMWYLVSDRPLGEVLMK